MIGGTISWDEYGTFVEITNDGLVVAKGWLSPVPPIELLSKDTK